ncbi:VOC family protein [Flagellimonas nanhaiensis]|uniref:VOC family protein n=1 Tax=Flagellimonas nanhaiensis TaxID=2292706 RepID=A0A371JST7_9FLAO|nr:VOC family protein [Allomuricauda nanhaiensis]RDY60880.1 VOC family protein [Allomuricauda nanhaiensis]
MKTSIALFALILCISCQNNSLKKDEYNIAQEAVQFRIARPTNNLEKIKDFYVGVLGLEEIESFKGHQGYSGIMLGLPGDQYHLEFTEHDESSELPKPTKENLMVLYFDTSEKYNNAISRLKNKGYMPVEPENPYWKKRGETYEDPDHWRIVLYNGIYQSNR